MKKKRQADSKKVTTIEGLAVLMMGEFERIETKFGAKFDASDARHARVEVHLAKLNERTLSIENELRGIRGDLTKIAKRLDRLEEDVRDIRGYAKELDELRAMFRALEKRIIACESR